MWRHCFLRHLAVKQIIDDVITFSIRLQSGRNTFKSCRSRGVWRITWPLSDMMRETVECWTRTSSVMIWNRLYTTNSHPSLNQWCVCLIACIMSILLAEQKSFFNDIDCRWHYVKKCNEATRRCMKMLMSLIMAVWVRIYSMLARYNVLTGLSWITLSIKPFTTRWPRDLPSRPITVQYFVRKQSEHPTRFLNSLTGSYPTENRLK